jgi:glucosyl-3-phosphoglycerate synthase
MRIRTNIISMEYSQERVTTLHAYDEAEPPAPVAETTVVVPLTSEDVDTPAATGVFETLQALDPGRVLVALRADRAQLPGVVEWFERFDVDASVLWCDAPEVEERLESAGLGGAAGKGRDVWLALGVAADSDYVVVHDADTHSYDRTHVPRLLYPLANGFSFSKGYYARVEDNRLYGRLCRLFVAPLLRALADEHDSEMLEYLESFRYPLAGEFATTGALARRLRVPRGWGLELGTLGEAFAHAGFEASAQVDLGTHEHDHRPATGSEGLETMAQEVGEALFTVLEAGDVDPDYTRLPGRYRSAAEHLVVQYAADAGFNGLTYDPAAERQQVDRYAGAIAPPGGDTRLPPWKTVELEPAAIAARSEEALGTIRTTP